MSRHMSKRGDGPQLGVIRCDRPRCREEYTWPITEP
jgi:hypothetical protein